MTAVNYQKRLKFDNILLYFLQTHLYFIKIQSGFPCAVSCEIF
jgi:hypothetical protein